MKIIRPTRYWSEITIDTDKDMNGTEMSNLRFLYISKGLSGAFDHVDKRWDALVLESSEDVWMQFLIPGSKMSGIQITTDEGRGYMNEGAFYYYALSNEFRARIKNNDVLRLSLVSVFSGLDKLIDLGRRENRWLNGWFAGSLAVGVIKNIGDTLTVDVVYDDTYTEVASYLDETNAYDLATWVDDWVIGTLDTYTENGIITGIKLQFEYNNYDSDDDWSYRLLEDGVEVMSFNLPANSTGTLSGEYTTLKTSAEYKTQLYSLAYNSDNWKIRNRYLHFRKRYIGIKAGS